MTNVTREKWWQHGFFGLHYDLHANAKDTRLGSELTHAHLREQLEKVRPDFVQCDCKGHPGYSGYPTCIGSPSPGIVRDALRIHRDVTQAMGIPLSVHYSGIWDTRAVELHPDWSAVDKNGKPISPRPGYKYGIVCPRGPYLDELMIPQLLEIIDNYDVDGFWIDGDNWAVRDCYCARCRRVFSERTGIDVPPVTTEHPDWPAWRAFQRDSFVEYVRKYAEAVHARKSTCAVCSNWMYSMRHPGPVTVPVDYLSGDFSSSERAEMEGRYFDGHRMPWNLMAWTFCSPDRAVPAQTKTLTHLCQEAAEVMSCGGGVFLYDQPQRSGWLTGWHQDIFAGVARFCRERQPFSQHTQSVPEAAVLFSDAHVWKHNPMPFCMGKSFYGLEGTLHVLIENQYHVDVLDETRMLERMNEYTLVVIGEQNPVSPAVLNALESYAAAGGTVLITGAHLAEMCPQLAGVQAVGRVSNTGWYLPVHRECAAISGPWRPVQPVDAAAHTPVMQQQQPGKDETGFPAVTIRKVGTGQVAAIHGDFMRSYYLSHQPRMRLFMKDLLDYLKVNRKLTVSGPPSLEVSLRRGKEFLAVHLVNRAVTPTLTTRLHMVEEIPATDKVTVRVSVDACPDRVTLEPGSRDVAWTYAGGWVEASVASVYIHDILAVRWTPRTNRKIR